MLKNINCITIVTTLGGNEKIRTEKKIIIKKITKITKTNNYSHGSFRYSRQSVSTLHSKHELNRIIPNLIPRLQLKNNQLLCLLLRFNMEHSFKRICMYVCTLFLVFTYVISDCLFNKNKPNILRC